jgi:FixJ family two-component response regulator
VLILTGQDQIHAEEALARGASEFLGKPVSPHVLEETVARLLKRALPADRDPGPVSAAEVER